MVKIGFRLQNLASLFLLVSLSILSSEPLSSFIALHVASHIYTRDTPCNTAFYIIYHQYTRRSYIPWSLHTGLVTYQGTAFHLSSHDARTYHCLLPVWGSPQLNYAIE